MRLVLRAILFAIAVPLAMLSAQQPESLVFEVATIKRNVTGVGSGGIFASGVISFNNATARDLIRRAYNLPSERVIGGRIGSIATGSISQARERRRRRPLAGCSCSARFSPSG
jgi:hypothetical protein